MIPTRTLNAVLTMILVIAGPFLFAMFLVYCIAGAKKDYSAPVCPENGQYSYEEMWKIHKSYGAKYEQFVEENCRPPPTEEINAGSSKVVPTVTMVKNVPTIDPEPEFDASCDGWVVDVGVSIFPSTCLPEVAERINDFVRSNFHVVTKCSTHDASHCIRDFIGDIKSLGKGWTGVATQAAVAKSKDPFKKAAPPVRACKKGVGKRGQEIFDCEEVSKEELVIRYIKKLPDGGSVSAEEPISVLPTCDATEEGKVCLVHENCEKFGDADGIE